MKQWFSSPIALAILALLGLGAGYALSDYAPVRYGSYVVLLTADFGAFETQIGKILNQDTLSRIIEARGLYPSARSGAPGATVIDRFRKDIQVTQMDQARVRLAYVSQDAKTSMGVLQDIVAALDAGGAPITVSGDAGLKSERPWRPRMSVAGLLCGLAAGWMIRRAARTS